MFFLPREGFFFWYRLFYNSNRIKSTNVRDPEITTGKGNTIITSTSVAGLSKTDNDNQDNTKLQLQEVSRNPFSQLNGPMIFKNPRKSSSSPKSVHKPMENGILLIWCKKKYYLCYFFLHQTQKFRGGVNFYIMLKVTQQKLMFCLPFNQCWEQNSS